jgi:hypothetical protein
MKKIIAAQEPFRAISVFPDGEVSIEPIVAFLIETLPDDEVEVVAITAASSLIRSGYSDSGRGLIDPDCSFSKFVPASGAKKAASECLDEMQRHIEQAKRMRHDAIRRLIESNDAPAHADHRSSASSSEALHG